MLRLSKAIQAEVKAQSAAAYPHEGCGLLLGHTTGGENVVTDLFPVENRWDVEEEKRVRFQIAPEDMLRAEVAAMRAGVDIIGIYHSHPDHEPVASARDLAWATWPGYSYLITEVRDGQPQGSRSWQLRPDRSGFAEEKIEISD